ncbi:hypothetical protein MW887_011094 [Aspergillus wentii]|nr:hypothetical protein MW887_011094 [Aspergillus wentii]
MAQVTKFEAFVTRSPVLQFDITWATPFLALPHVQSFCGFTCIGMGGHRSIVSEYLDSNFKSGLEVVDISFADVDWMVITDLLKHTPRLKKLKYLHMADANDTSHDWDLCRFITAIEHEVGSHLEQLCISIHELPGAIKPGSVSMRGFQRLRKLVLPLELVLCTMAPANHESLLSDLIPASVSRLSLLSHTEGHPEHHYKALDRLFHDFAARKDSHVPALKEIYLSYPSDADDLYKDQCDRLAAEAEKESSAELSEAINSMYRWYQKSAICYAYLSDVDANEDQELLSENIKNSKWFTRGWTLQELVAPPKLFFLASNWSDMGSKADMSALIQDITGIDESALVEIPQLERFSIAKRMSWAANRHTTRVEDIAYCLMGLFNVNMPLLYGEGDKAFIRLQEEILRGSADQTLFAWQRDDVSHDNPSGLLAQSPWDFKDSGGMVPFLFAKRTEPVAVTNLGIRVHLPKIRNLLILQCQDTSKKKLTIPSFKDIGGVAPPDPDKGWGLSHIPLVWMLREAIRAGLDFDIWKIKAQLGIEADPKDYNGESFLSIPDVYDYLLDAARNGRLHGYFRRLPYSKTLWVTTAITSLPNFLTSLLANLPQPD